MLQVSFACAWFRPLIAHTRPVLWQHARSNYSTTVLLISIAIPRKWIKARYLALLFIQEPVLSRCTRCV